MVVLGSQECPITPHLGMREGLLGSYRDVVVTRQTIWQAPQDILSKNRIAVSVRPMQECLCQMNNRHTIYIASSTTG